MEDVLETAGLAAGLEWKTLSAHVHGIDLLLL